MKTALTLLAGIIVFLSISTADAAPVGVVDGGYHYATAATMLDQWSVGLYMRDMQREVEVKGRDSRLDNASVGGYLGYDVRRWLMVYGTLGTSETKFYNGPVSDTETEWGLGLRIGLLNHELMDLSLYEDHIQVTAQFNWINNEREDGRSVLEWEERSAALLVSLINDTDANVLFWPKQIALHAGPVYSSLSGDIVEKDEFGASVGMDIRVSEKVTVSLKLEHFDEETLQASINARL